MKTKSSTYANNTIENSWNDTHSWSPISIFLITFSRVSSITTGGFNCFRPESTDIGLVSVFPTFIITNVSMMLVSISLINFCRKLNYLKILLNLRHRCYIVCLLKINKKSMYFLNEFLYTNILKYLFENKEYVTNSRSSWPKPFLACPDDLLWFFFISDRTQFTKTLYNTQKGNILIIISILFISLFFY